MRSRQQSPLAGSYEFCVITLRKWVTVGIHRHCESRMPETSLHGFGREPQAPILDTIKTPRCVPVPQRVQPPVAGHDNSLAVLILRGVNNTSGNQGRPEATVDDVGMRLWIARAIGKDQMQLPDHVAVSVATTAVPF